MIIETVVYRTRNETIEEDIKLKPITRNRGDEIRIEVTSDNGDTYYVPIPIEQAIQIANALKLLKKGK